MIRARAAQLVAVAALCIAAPFAGCDAAAPSPRAQPDEEEPAAPAPHEERVEQALEGEPEEPSAAIPVGPTDDESCPPPQAGSFIGDLFADVAMADLGVPADALEGWGASGWAALGISTPLHLGTRELAVLNASSGADGAVFIFRRCDTRFRLVGGFAVEGLAAGVAVRGESHAVGGGRALVVVSIERFHRAYDGQGPAGLESETSNEWAGLVTDGERVWLEHEPSRHRLEIRAPRFVRSE